MMEEARDNDNHLICYADAKKGLIEHTYPHDLETGEEENYDSLG